MEGFVYGQFNSCTVPIITIPVVNFCCKSMTVHFTSQPMWGFANTVLDKLCSSKVNHTSYKPLIHKTKPSVVRCYTNPFAFFICLFRFVLLFFFFNFFSKCLLITLTQTSTTFNRPAARKVTPSVFSFNVKFLSFLSVIKSGMAFNATSYKSLLCSFELCFRRRMCRAVPSRDLSNECKKRTKKRTYSVWTSGVFMGYYVNQKASPISIHVGTFCCR